MYLNICPFFFFFLFLDPSSSEGLVLKSPESLIYSWQHLHLYDTFAEIPETSTPQQRGWSAWTHVGSLFERSNQYKRELVPLLLTTKHGFWRSSVSKEGMSGSFRRMIVKDGSHDLTPAGNQPPHSWSFTPCTMGGGDNLRDKSEKTCGLRQSQFNR